jgi:hypothetical protein
MLTVSSVKKLHVEEGRRHFWKEGRRRIERGRRRGGGGMKKAKRRRRKG